MYKRQSVNNEVNCTECFVLVSEESCESISFYENFFWKKKIVFDKSLDFVTYEEACQQDNIKCSHKWWR